MPFAQVHYPFEQRRVVRVALPRRLHRRVRGPDPGLVLHAARAGHRPVRPAALPTTAWPTASSRATTAARCPSASGNYPEPDMVFDTWGADAMRWFLLSSPDPARPGPGRPRQGHRRGPAPGPEPASGTPGTSCRSTPTSTASGDAAAPTPPGVLDRYILAKTAALVDDVTASMDAYDLFGACAAITSFLDALTNWYIRRSRDRFWRARDGLGRRRSRTRPTPTTPCPPCSSPCAGLAAPLLPLLTETDLPGPHRRAQRPPGRLARRRPSCPPTPSWSRPWTSCATSARPAHAIRKAKGRRARLPAADRSPWPPPIPNGCGPSSTSSPTR